MRANVTAAYADAFCASFVPSNLTTQHWVDQPMCQRANSTFKVPHQLELPCTGLVTLPACSFQQRILCPAASFPSN